MAPFELINAFIVFEESKNIYEASRKLGISQPSLSLKLQSLEVYVGKPLFTTKGKKKVLNSFGQSFYLALHQHFKEIENTYHFTVNSSKDYKNLIVKIAGRKEILSEMSPQIIFPGQVELISATTNQSIQLLLDRKIQFAISHKAPDSTEIFSTHLMTSFTQILIHQDHISPTQQRYKVEHFFDHNFLKSTPFISYNKKMHFISDWCRHAQFPIKDIYVKTYVDDWYTVTEFARHHRGFTIVPKSIPVPKELIAFDVPESVLKGIKFYLLYPKEVKKLFPIDKVFQL